MSATSFTVSGKTAIVTGAGSGINLAFAKLLLSKNCNVLIADLALRDEAKALLQQYSQGSQGKPRAVFVETDVCSWPALSGMFDTALREFGGFDVVCPGAGVFEEHWSNFWRPPGSAASRDSVDGGRYRLFDINLTHPIRTAQLALSHWLHPRGAGDEAAAAAMRVSVSNPKRIIHISSIAGQIPMFVTPLYAASKFAISGFVKSLAPLEAQVGVRVAAVAPGITRTPIWTEHREKMGILDEARDAWVTPEEVAEAMLRCVEGDEFAGGTVLEVGLGSVRVVETFNDPGPDSTPGAGFTMSNGQVGVDESLGLLKDEGVWGAGAWGARA